MSHDQLHPTDLPSTDETIEVPAEHRLDSETGMSPRATELARRKKRNRNFIIGGIGIATAISVGLGVKAASGENDSNLPKSEPTASGPAVAGESEPSAEAPAQSVEAVAGEAGSTLENISVKPSQEIINEALEAVTLADFPTPEEALVQFGKIENVILISGTVEAEVQPGSGSIDVETPESIAEGEALWRNLLSEEGLQAYDWQNNQRKLYAMELFFINESGAISSDAAGTFHRDWIVDAVQSSGGNTFSADITKKSITNIGELDEYATQNFPDITPLEERAIVVQLHNDGDRWFIDDMNAVE